MFACIALIFFLKSILFVNYLWDYKRGTDIMAELYNFLKPIL